MACHRGNASFTDVVASDCNQTFSQQITFSRDPHVKQLLIYSNEEGTKHHGHFRIFKLRHYAVISFSLAISFADHTPAMHSITTLTLPDDLRAKPGTISSSPIIVEYVVNDETFTSVGSAFIDATKVGDDGSTLETDVFQLKTLGIFTPGPFFVCRGCLQIEPAII